MSADFLENIIFWPIVLIGLALSVVLFTRKVWLPYSKFLILIFGYLILINFLSLFHMPDWINSIWFGIAFLIFPILDGITTRVAISRYGAKEANPIMAWLIKKLGINVATFLPFLFFLVLILLFWQQLDSSILFAISIFYCFIILNNLLVIRRKKKRADIISRTPRK